MSAGIDSHATGALPALPQQGLTSDEIARFVEDGFLILRQRLPNAALNPLIGELSRKVGQGVEEALSAGLLDPSHTFADAPFEGRLALVSKACTDPTWIWKRHFSVQKPRTVGLFHLRTEPVLLDMVESLIGPEILAHPQYSLRTKMPDQEITVIPWHQDLAYLIPAQAGQTLVVNLWIPLADATLANGCMQVVRGSHRLGLLPHNHRETTPGHQGVQGHCPGRFARRRDRRRPASPGRRPADHRAPGAPLPAQYHRDGALEPGQPLQPDRPAQRPPRSARFCRPQPPESAASGAEPGRLGGKILPLKSCMLQDCNSRSFPAVFPPQAFQ